MLGFVIGVVIGCVAMLWLRDFEAEPDISAESAVETDTKARAPIKPPPLRVAGITRRMSLFDKRKYDKIVTYCTYMQDQIGDIKLKLDYYERYHSKLPDSADQILKLLEESYSALNRAYELAFKDKD